MSESAPVPASTAVGAGRMLSRLREEQGLSVIDVAQRLKYAGKQIEALEAEEFDKLPGSTFIRGMVRSYAKLVGADPQPVLSALDRQYSPGEVSLDLRNKGVPFKRSGRHSTRIYLLTSVLVLILAGAAYEWRAGAFPWARWTPAPPAPREAVVAPATPTGVPVVAPAAPVTEAATPPPTPAAPAVQAAPSAPPAKEGRIELQFDGESWVEIKAEDGKMLMSQLNQPGSRKVVVGQPPMSLVIGNAAAVRLSYNDKAIDLKPYIEIEVARLTLE